MCTHISNMHVCECSYLCVYQWTCTYSNIVEKSCILSCVCVQLVYFYIMLYVYVQVHTMSCVSVFVCVSMDMYVYTMYFVLVYTMHVHSMLSALQYTKQSTIFHHITYFCHDQCFCQHSNMLHLSLHHYGQFTTHKSHMCTHTQTIWDLLIVLI